MAYRTITELRLKLLDAFKMIKIANGYSLDIPDCNIRPNFDPKFKDQKDTEDYPKVMLILDDGVIGNLPSRRKEKELIFFAVLVDKAHLGPDGETYDQPAESKVEALIEVVDRLTAMNPTLGDFVMSFSTDGFTTDSGYTHPEGTAVVRLKLEYQVQY